MGDCTAEFRNEWRSPHYVLLYRALGQGKPVNESVAVVSGSVKFLLALLRFNMHPPYAKVMRLRESRFAARN